MSHSSALIVLLFCNILLRTSNAQYPYQYPQQKPNPYGTRNLGGSGGSEVFGPPSGGGFPPSFGPPSGGGFPSVFGPPSGGGSPPLGLPFPFPPSGGGNCCRSFNVLAADNKDRFSKKSSRVTG